jgi:hypothetical protein
MSALLNPKTSEMPFVVNKDGGQPIQIVNQNTGEPIVLPDAFRIDDSTGIKLLSHPRDWRAMVEKGKGFFTCNGDESGKQLRMRILNYRLEEGVLFSDVYKEPESVIQAVFIDENDIVGTIVFRTASRDNFLHLVDNLTAKRIPIATQIISANMEKVTSKAGWVFHLVRFTSETNSRENFEDIKTFISLVPEALTCFRNLPRPE